MPTFDPSEIEDRPSLSMIGPHSLHDNVFHDTCEKCLIELRMKETLTPRMFREWMDREDHEQCLEKIVQRA